MFLYILLLGLILIALVFGGFYAYEREALFQQAENYADNSYQQLLDVIEWSHLDGGVFRPTPKEALDDGYQSVSPCSIIRDLAGLSKRYGDVNFRIVSPGGVGPKRPDAFERSALEHVIRTGDKMVARESNRPDARLRALYPLLTGERCLKCHEKRANGDILGAISITVPLASKGITLAHIRRYAIFMGLLVVVTLSGLAYLLGWRTLKERIQNLSRIYKQTTQDPLTNLLNRETLLERMESEVMRARRLSLPTSIMIIDIDHFRELNDRFGRKMGDEILRNVSRRMVEQLRAYDILGRSAGGEFIVILPETVLEAALEVANRLIFRVSENPVDFGRNKAPVTISMGAVELGGANETVDAILSRLRQALKNAQANGGNRVETDDFFRIRP